MVSYRKKVFAADFETTSIANLEQDGYVRVWLWSIVDTKTMDEYYGLDMQSFIDNLFDLECEICFFHNLKFDGYFIVSWLEREGYVYAEDYEVSIDNLNNWYQIIIKINDRIVRIWDSLKKFPGQSLDNIAELYNIRKKNEKPDFERYRPLDYSPSTEEIDYCLQDSRILAHAINSEFMMGHQRMTLSSDAFESVKSFIGGYKGWRKNFPELSLAEDRIIRPAYKGGWVYVNPIYQEKELDNVTVYDFNSLYPSIMHDCILPYKEPRLRKPVGGEQYIITFDCQFSLRDGFLPTIQVKNDMRYKQTEYITESMGITRLSLTNLDYELFKKHYEIEYFDNSNYISFACKKGLLAKYVDYWTEVKIQAKKNHDDATYYIAKRWLNSPYGKTGTKPDRISKEPYLDEETNIVKFLSKEDVATAIYIPYATFVTAWARYKIITAAQKEYDNFIYADTDSLHLLGDNHDLEVDDYKLGYLKCEGRFEKAKYLRPKTYIHATKDYKIEEIKCAGMPDTVKEKVNWDDFVIGNSWKDGKLQQKHVPGGCVLRPTKFTLQE